MSDISNLYAGKLAQQSSPDNVTALLVKQLSNRANLSSTGVIGVAGAGAHSVSLENLDDSGRRELGDAVSALKIALEEIGSSVEGADRGNVAFQAALTAGVSATSIRDFYAHQFAATPADINKPGLIVRNMEAFGADGTSVPRMRPALEAFDESENKNSQAWTVAYNWSASRQDEAGELFFPTSVITPDQFGLAMSIRLIQVYPEVTRQTTGTLDKFNRRNVIQAVIDPTLLKNDMLKIIPVFRDGSKEQFVDEALLAPRTIEHDGITVTTQPLAIGADLSLLGISQTEELLKTGLMNSTDQIDPNVRLEAVYVKIGTGADAEVIRFETAELPYATFNYAVQNNYRQMNLAFDTGSLLLNKNTKQADGTASVLLEPLVNGDYTVRLKTKVSGSVNLDTADTNLFASKVAVNRIISAAKEQLDPTTGAGKTIADLFIGAEVVGYDLDARRSNANRRERGQLLDITFFNQVYGVPLLSPITCPRPLAQADQDHSTELSALITATRVRTSNAAIAKLLADADMLRDYYDNRDSMDQIPEILGVSRYLVQPWFKREPLDVAASLDSLDSVNRRQAICALIVNKISDMVYQAYQASGIKAAADALAGGVAPLPEVLIVTDPYIHQYIFTQGDLRTLGGINFTLKVVSTLNQDMAGKIIFSFGQPNMQEGVPHPLHYGVMAWKSEVVTRLPIHRAGGNQLELTVQPSFRHITNLPIMGVLDVSGISAVVASKVALNNHPV